MASQADYQASSSDFISLSEHRAPVVAARLATACTPGRARLGSENFLEKLLQTQIEYFWLHACTPLRNGWLFFTVITRATEHVASVGGWVSTRGRLLHESDENNRLNGAELAGSG